MSLIRKEIREIEKSQKKNQNEELKEVYTKISKILDEHLDRSTKIKTSFSQLIFAEKYSEDRGTIDP